MKAPFYQASEVNPRSETRGSANLYARPLGDRALATPSSLMQRHAPGQQVTEP